MNFTELKDVIAQWLDVDINRFPETMRGWVVNMAVKEISRAHDFRVNEKKATFTTSQGTQTNDLPDRFSRPYLVQYLNGSGALVKPEYLTPEHYWAKYPDPTDSGEWDDPLHWTYWGDKVYWGPVPNSALSIDMLYYEIPVDLSGSDSTDLTTESWDIVVFRALSIATTTLFEDPRAPLFEAKAMKLERDEAIAQRRARSAGRRVISTEPGTVT